MRNGLVVAILLSAIAFSGIWAQEKPILPGQKFAIQALAKNRGFTEGNLDEYLTKVWGKSLADLTQEEGAGLIRLFQSADSPEPKDVLVTEPVETVQRRTRVQVLAEILEEGMSKRFHLVDGNIIRGEITRIEGGIAHIETIDGLLKVPTSQILEETASISKRDDTRYVGPVLKETAEDFVIRSAYGDVVISKRDIRDIDRYHGGTLVPWAEEKKTFYRGQAILTDIFTDPTAFPLEANTFYISGLSIGYAFDDWLMLRTQFGSDLNGDLNLHPLIRFYHRKTGTSERAAAVGFHIFDHHPMKTLVAKYAKYVKNGSGMGLADPEAPPLVTVMTTPDVRDIYGEVYLVLSSRQSLATGRGNMGWHVGAKTNTLLLNQPGLSREWKWDNKGLLVPYRFWFAFEYDLWKDMTFATLIWADNGHKFRDIGKVWKDYFSDGSPFILDSPRGIYRLVDFDFGFLYAWTETFRVGIHFQEPYLVFYWEFLGL